jgi:hypothetical protein
MSKDAIAAWVVIVGVATVLIAFAISQSQQTERLKFEKGYTQRYVYGAATMVWIAPTDSIGQRMYQGIGGR